MYLYSFEKLEVWNDAKLLAKSVYYVTENFPLEEKFGLTSQMRCAAISISSNIAEGSTRKTSKDQAHFITMAFSSAVELLNQIIISNELGHLKKEDIMDLRLQIEKVTNKLNALRRSKLNKKTE